MIGRVIFQSILILAALISSGICGITLWKDGSVSTIGDGKVSVRWAGDGPEFKYVGSGSNDYTFSVPKHTIGGSSSFTVSKASHSDWTSFAIGMEHTKTSGGKSYITIE